jgi:peptidoglycan/LPS O-acetylase OafA/YrhL
MRGPIGSVESGPETIGKQKSTSRIDGLDCLRLLLALVVIVFHYGYGSRTLGIIPGVHEGLRPLVFGRYAVEAFFVISGLVIAQSARGRPLPDFARSRFLRLAPALMICATITFVVTRLFADVVPHTQIRQWLASITVVPLFFNDDLGADWSYWSLTCELRFYVLAGVFFVLFRSTEAILWGCALWVGASFIACFVHEPLIDMITINRASACFILGVCMYLLMTERAYWWPTVGVTAAASVLLPLQMLYEAIKRPVAQMITPVEAVVATAFIIALVSCAVRIRDMGFLARFARAAGAISYPLYLIHQFIGFIIIRRLALLGADWHLAACAAAVVAIFLASVIALWLEPWLARILKAQFGLPCQSVKAMT